MGKITKTTTLLIITLSVMAIILLPAPTVIAQTRTLAVPDQYPTIQSAVGNASDGDTVFVKKGTYIIDGFREITLDKPISLIGEDPKSTIINGVNKSRDIFYMHYFWNAIKVLSSDVTISGFTIINCNTAISLDQSVNGYRPIQNIRITNNNIENNSRPIVGSGAGSNLVISKNNVSGNDYGIQFSGWSDSLFSENNLIGNGGGLSLDDCTAVTITQNKIIGNGISNNEVGISQLSYTGGLFLRWQGPYYVYGNIISENFYFGVEFEGSNNSTIAYNSIVNNSAGVLLFNYGYSSEHSSIPRIASGNRFYLNNLINNKQNVVVEHSPFYNTSTAADGNGTDIISWDDGFAGNYWSDYIGYGNYVIDENNVDNHPQTQPVNIPSILPNSFLFFWLQPLIITFGIVSAGIVTFFLYRRHRKT